MSNAPRILVTPDALLLVVPLGDPDDLSNTVTIRVTEELHGQLLAHADAMGMRLVKPKVAKAPPAQMKDRDAGFVEFWAAYPRKDGKAQSLEVWRSKFLTARSEAIIRDVERRSQTPDWTKERGKYCPLPTTYLRSRRWEDTAEIDPGQASRWL